MMPTYGNHEIDLREGYGAWAARFPTPRGFDDRRNYSFDVGDVHFVSLCAGLHDREGLKAEQLAWLERDIKAARKAGRRWIVPFMHSAPFSDGTNHGTNAPLRAQLGPLFERLEIPVVLTSHDQSYERTFPLRGVPGAPRATSAAKDCYTERDGVTWVKSSPGGKMSNISGAFSPFATHPAPAHTAVRNNTRHHFTRLVVRASGVLRVETYGLTGDGSTPALVDSFEYRHGACATPKTAAAQAKEAP